MFIPPNRYPTDLLQMREQVLATLPDIHEKGRVSSCKGYHSQCNSIYCPSCVRAGLYHRRGRIVTACSSLTERRRKNLQFATLLTADVPLEELRAVAKTSADAMRKTLRSVGVSGHVTCAEISFPRWDDQCHLHYHCLIDSAPSGRGYVPKGALTDAWMSALPADLLPPLVEVHIKPVDSLEAVATYVCTSPFFDYVKAQASLKEVSRTLDAIRETKGLPKITSRGSLTLPEA
jgi:hypothetical protein